MKILSLYRGIAVPSARAGSVFSNISSRGLYGNEGKWAFVVPDVARVRKQLDVLFTRPGLTREDLFQNTPFPGICACGSPIGAEYYAARHNYSPDKNDHPIVIEFDAPLDKVYVDPRDFLCTAFQFWDRDSVDQRAFQAGFLSELFGQRILRYFDSACRVTDQTHRIAMCNLAAFDPEVVLAHYSNRKVIRGRYGTLFTSSFFVQGPVSPERISRLYTVEQYNPPRADVSLDGFLGRVGA